MTSSTSIADTGGAPAAARRIRIMIVDDHPIYRDGLTAVLGLHPDLEVVTEAGNGADAVERFRAHRPDVTLMDLSMPVMGGAAATAEIIAAFPAARIIALTTFQGDTDIHRVLEAGARGYLLKDAVRHEVADAVRTVHRDGWVVPDSVAQRLAEFVPRVELTGRELEVLTLMAKGMSNKAIAGAIFRTEATVKVHVAHVLQKLDAGDRTEAVVVAHRRGIIRLDG
jgi:DNA-binding NarL/FixJ family response regulator